MGIRVVHTLITRVLLLPQMSQLTFWASLIVSTVEWMISKTFQSCDSIKGSLVELSSLSLYIRNHMGWLQMSHPFGSEQLL